MVEQSVTHRLSPHWLFLALCQFADVFGIDRTCQFLAQQLSRVVGCNPVFKSGDFLGHTSHSDGNGIVLIVYHTKSGRIRTESGLTKWSVATKISSASAREFLLVCTQTKGHPTYARADCTGCIHNYHRIRQ
jgi:hypothetical protein